MQNISYSVQLPGREEIHLDLVVDQNRVIQQSRLEGVGGPQLLDLLVEWRGRLQGALDQLEVPMGQDIGAMLLRELILKAKNQWFCPQGDEVICHCRGVKSKTLNDAILLGAHDVHSLRLKTSASSACGTCAPVLKNLIENRLYKGAEQDLIVKKAS